MALLFIALLIVSCNTAKSGINRDSGGIAIKGYDPVAYFTMGMPVKGDNRFSHEWNGATWLFANEKHRDLFAADPDTYAPQYGGY